MCFASIFTAQRANKYNLWELAGEGGGHSSGREADAILTSTKHRMKIRRERVLFSVFCVVMKRQSQPLQYKDEKQKNKSPKQSCTMTEL